MWIVMLNFCLFLLLVSLFLYGLKNWRNLLNEPDEEELPATQIDWYYYRAPFWVLIAGIGLYSVFRELLDFFA